MKTINTYFKDCEQPGSTMYLGHGYTGSSGYIVSPNLNYNSSHGRCQWRIHAPVNQVTLFVIHPCDPTVVICYLIWPCDMAVCITYLISHSFFFKL